MSSGSLPEMLHIKVTLSPSITALFVSRLPLILQPMILRGSTKKSVKRNDKDKDEEERGKTHTLVRYELGYNFMHYN
jgi:hypothetical protein